MLHRYLIAVVALFWLGGCSTGDGGEDVCASCVDTEASNDTGPAEDTTIEYDVTVPEVLPSEVTDDAVAEDVAEDDQTDEPEIIENLEPGDLKRIEGSVVDGDGNPIEGLFVQPCTYSADLEQCHKAITDADGKWHVSFMPAKTDLVGIHVRFVTEDYSPSACYWDLADLDMPDNVVSFTAPFVVFDQGNVLASADFGVDAPTHIKGSGVEFTVASSEWFPGIFEPVDFKVMQFPLDEYVPCFLDEGNLPTALYSMVPDWLSFSTPGGVAASFDNVAGLPAGSAVDFYVLGALDTMISPLDGEPTYLKTGDWFKFGTGTVSEDGTVITTDVGSGLPGIGWVGYKAQ